MQPGTQENNHNDGRKETTKNKKKQPKNKTTHNTW